MPIFRTLRIRDVLLLRLQLEKKLFGDKRSSLLCLTVRDEAKQFDDIDSPSLAVKVPAGCRFSGGEDRRVKSRWKTRLKNLLSREY